MLRKGFEQEGEPVEFEPKLSKVPLRHETRPRQLGHVITMRNASKIILRFVVYIYIILYYIYIIINIWFLGKRIPF